MSKDFIRLVQPWLRKCRKCGDSLVIVYNNDTESKCGSCGVINKILWLPTTYIIE